MSQYTDFKEELIRIETLCMKKGYTINRFYYNSDEITLNVSHQGKMTAVRLDEDGELKYVAPFRPRHTAKATS